jgi:hypothetical protein
MAERTVYKYDVPVDNKSHLFVIPGPSKIVHVECQRTATTVQFWAEVPTDVAHADHDHRLFQVFPTGIPIPEEPDPSQYWQHVGTAVTVGGALVWHLYELITEDPF